MNFKRKIIGIGIACGLVLGALCLPTQGESHGLSKSELVSISGGGWCSVCDKTNACPTSENSVCEGVTCKQHTIPTVWCETSGGSTKCAGSGTYKTCKLGLGSCTNGSGSDACGNLVRPTCPATAGGVCSGGCIQEYTETACKKNC